jgi:copper(I)-binding protein
MAVRVDRGGHVTPSRTSSHDRAGTRRLVVAAVAAGLGGAVALAGCSVGQVTQTSSQVAPVPGINADAGQVALRNLVIAYPGPGGYPAGSDAPLVVRLFNNGMTPITLVGVSAQKAASVTLVGTPEVVRPTETPPPPTGTAPPEPTATGAPQSTATASPEPTALPTPTVAPTTQPPTTPVSITIPPQSFVLLVPGEASGHLRLNRLTEAITPGESTDVTFTFSDGSTATVPVPLAPPTREIPRATPIVEPGHAEA